MSAFRATRPAFATLRQIARPAYSTTARQVAARPVARLTQLQGLRFKTDNLGRSAFAKNPIITYDELKPITEQPSDDILLVDVRERDENALGSIPSAVNLPLSELKEALSEGYNAGDFQSKYAFQKPVPKQNIIFFCRSGKRSATAGELAGERGYHNVRNYQGSWLDWSKRESSSRNDDDD